MFQRAKAQNNAKPRAKLDRFNVISVMRFTFEKTD